MYLVSYPLWDIGNGYNFFEKHAIGWLTLSFPSYTISLELATISLPSHPVILCCSWPNLTRDCCLDCLPGPYLQIINLTLQLHSHPTAYLWKTSLAFLLFPACAGPTTWLLAEAVVNLLCRGVNIADTCNHFKIILPLGTEEIRRYDKTVINHPHQYDIGVLAYLGDILYCELISTCSKLSLSSE